MLLENNFKSQEVELTEEFCQMLSENKKLIRVTNVEVYDENSHSITESGMLDTFLEVERTHLRANRYFICISKALSVSMLDKKIITKSFAYFFVEFNKMGHYPTVKAKILFDDNNCMVEVNKEDLFNYVGEEDEEDEENGD